jgi:hypothetical protein
VFCALALNGIPIDVLAARLGTTRGALYKTLHDARRNLRSALGAAGYPIDAHLELAGADADRRLPGMREHLHGCPACHEDHESLRDFVRLQAATLVD